MLIFLTINIPTQQIGRTKFVSKPLTSKHFNFVKNYEYFDNNKFSFYSVLDAKKAAVNFKVEQVLGSYVVNTAKECFKTNSYTN